MVVATDGGKYNGRRTSVPVEIEISDVNDNAPVFEDYPFRAQIPVSTQIGQNVLKVRAFDADESLNGDLVYSFPMENPAQTLFQIHPNSGIVTVASSLSQENGKLHRIEVEARDRGTPSLISRGILELQIGEVSDFAASINFKNETYELTLAENAFLDSELFRVTAVRSDGRLQQIMYSIGAGNELGVFSIYEGTGALRLAYPPGLKLGRACGRGFPEDREIFWPTSVSRNMDDNSPKFCLTLVARTQQPESLEAYAKLYVKVTDVNDNAPIFTQAQYSATVLEGNAKGDFVVKVYIYIVNYNLEI